MTQMLLRASNGVGYTNYPDNVVTTFVAQAAKPRGSTCSGCSTASNWVENMRVAMDAVVETGKICEAAICYTGDLLDPAREIRPRNTMSRWAGPGDAGAHVLGLKDMAGLLKPLPPIRWSRALKEEVGLPVHFHTHDTSGVAAASIPAAARAGSMRSTPRWTASRAIPRSLNLGSVVEALLHTERDTGLDIEAIRQIRIIGKRCAPVHRLRGGA